MLARDGHEVALPLDGTLTRPLSGAASVIELTSTVGSSPLRIHGSIDPTSGHIELAANTPGFDINTLLPLMPANVTRAIDSASGTLSLDASYVHDHPDKATLALRLHQAAVDMSSQLDAKASGIDASVDFDRLLEPATLPGQMVTIKELVAAGATITDVPLTFAVSQPQEVKIEDLRGLFAGGEVRVEPFTIDPSHPVIATTLIADHVGIGPTVALLTDGRGGGSGRFSGSVPVTIDPSKLKSGDAVVLGDGSFTTDGTGNLHLGDATTKFEQVLEQSNPDFASDPDMADMKNDIVEAVRDFDYDLLDVQFSRRGENDVIELRLQGRGRTGTHVPIHLGFTIEGGAALLNDYLQLKSRVFSPGPAKASP